MHPVLARALPFAVFLAFIALAPVLDAWSASLGMDPHWWYGVRTAVVGVLLLAFAPAYTELQQVAPVRGRVWAMSAALGLAVFVLWINLDLPWLALPGNAGYDASTPQHTIDWRFAGIRLFGAAVVVPVMEELFWRSFMLRWLQQREFLEVQPAAVGGRALVIGAVLFGIEHHLWFVGVIAGLAYGWLYVRTGSLWPAIVAHAMTNALLGAWVLMTGQWQFW